MALAGVFLGFGPTHDASACYVHAGQYQGLTVRHALSVPVSVSTRRAIVAGELQDIPRATTAERTAALKQLVSVVGIFGKLSERDKSASTAPDFAVLLTESGLWTGFGAAEDGTWRVRQHLSAPAESDIVIVLSDPAMAALLRGEMTVERAAQEGILRVDDGSWGAPSLAAFSHLVERFSRSRLAGFQWNRKVPNVRFANPVSPFVKTQSN